MAIKKYLDEQGLATLWEKIKNVFAKKTDIPIVNNAKLTIKRNGTSAGTFTANQATDTEINIIVPTGSAADKAVDTSIATGSTSANLPTSKAVADHVGAQIKSQVTDKIGSTIAPLGSDGIVPAAYLPSYVDDAIEGYYYNNKFYTTSSHTQEIAGETGKIYVDLSTNKTFRWSGTTFVNISNPIAIGTTAGTAYDGASGAKNASDIATLKISVAEKVDKADGKGLSTNDYTTDEKNKLSGIASGAEVNQNAFSIIKVGETSIAADAKTDTLNIVAGTNITITPDATNDKITIAAKDTTYGTASSAANGLMSSTDKAKLNALSSSNSAIVTNGGGITTPGTGLSKSGNTINHTNAITAQTTSKFVAVKVDAQGHISAIGDELTALTTTEITEILV